MANIKLLRTIDKYILKLGLITLIPFQKQNHSTNKKILFIRLWGLGDSINTLPIINKLHKKNYKIDILTTKNCEIIFKNQPIINKTYSFEFTNPTTLIKLLKTLNQNKYEYIIDSEQFINTSTFLTSQIKAKHKIGFNLPIRNKFYTKTYNYSEQKHFIENFIQLIQPITQTQPPTKLIPIQIQQQNKTKINNILKNQKQNKLLGIHLGTAGTALGRRWHENNFLELINKLNNHKNITIILTGTNYEKKIYNKIKNKIKNKNIINTINKLNLKEFAYLTSKLNLFLSNDTGAMHISASMNCKTIGLFGLNSPKKVGAWPLTKHHNIHHNPNNNPIINNQKSIYPKNKYSTINLITVKEIYNIIITFLK